MDLALWFLSIRSCGSCCRPAVFSIGHCRWVLQHCSDTLNLATWTEVICSPLNKTGVPMKRRNFSTDFKRDPLNWLFTRTTSWQVQPARWMSTFPQWRGGWSSCAMSGREKYLKPLLLLRNKLRYVSWKKIYNVLKWKPGKVWVAVETAGIIVQWNASSEAWRMSGYLWRVHKLQQRSPRNNGLYRWVLQRAQASRI